ncbi:MAG: sodium:proton antiporter [Cyanobacteriota bacterium]|nr:sodium:proton antiporter [Cyanobacteriota bacterium]
MGFLLSCLFRLLLWGLLTADTGAVNLLIGLGLALLLPHAQGPRQPLGALLRALGRALVAVPKAFGEALALIQAGGAEQEDWIEQPASSGRQRLVIFLEVLAITLTPFTLVLGLSQVDGRPMYRIHRLRPASRERGNRPVSDPRPQTH